MELATDLMDAPPMTYDGTPQLYFDQINVIHHHLKDLYDEKHCPSGAQVDATGTTKNLFKQRELLNWQKYE